jgi:hypothetical protein
VKESNHLGPTRAQKRPIELLRDHVMTQQVLFHLSTLEMLRISIDYVALFLYIENISVVVDVLHLSQSHTILCGRATLRPQWPTINVVPHLIPVPT